MLCFKYNVYLSKGACYMNYKNIKAGTGKAVINIMSNVFPIDNFNGIHDALHARVL